jgi:uncharacterized protein YfkK (UPF0435 family)
VNGLLNRLHFAEVDKIMLSTTSPDAYVTQKVKETLELLLEKRMPPIKQGDEGAFYATKLLEVFFYEDLKGIYWLVRKKMNSLSPSTQ